MVAPRVAWLGDDFTGAAAVMEVLTFGGVPSVLFLSRPTPERLTAFANYEGIGIATMARTWAPGRMRTELPVLFDTLALTGAGLMHYKVCSTLDSAPHVGSIGCAMEIGADLFGAVPIPVVVAAPRLRRWQVFGQLFAGYGEGVYRLDRHPVMARHPVTPMGEADVARHLSAQTKMPVKTLDQLKLRDQAGLPEGLCGVAIDFASEDDAARIGHLLWEAREERRFVVGSQGIEYALVAGWRETGSIAEAPDVTGLGRAERMAVVSGSVSPVTAEQIDWARGEGFRSIALDPLDVSEAAQAEAVIAARGALDAGEVPLVHSAEGPDGAVRLSAEENDRVGRALGAILRRLVGECGLGRVVVSGGDTSGHVCAALGLYALTALAPTIPGAAILRGHADGPMDGIEIALKGGQMGSRDYFGWIRDGGGPR